MSFVSVILFFLLLFYYSVYILRRIEVDPRNFTVTHEKDVNADLEQFFNFFRHTHVLEKLCPWLWRLKEADARILSSGKFYTALLHLPLLGERRIYLTVTNFKPSKYFALESRDDFIKHRIEIRLRRYENRLLLQIRIFCNKTTALFQYTVGNILFYATRKRLKQSIQNVVEMYESISEREIN